MQLALLSFRKAKLQLYSISKIEAVSKNAIGNFGKLILHNNNNINNSAVAGSSGDDKPLLELDSRKDVCFVSLRILNTGLNRWKVIAQSLSGKEFSLDVQK